MKESGVPARYLLGISPAPPSDDADDGRSDRQE